VGCGEILINVTEPNLTYKHASISSREEHTASEVAPAYVGSGGYVPPSGPGAKQWSGVRGTSQGEFVPPEANVIYNN